MYLALYNVTNKDLNKDGTFIFPHGVQVIGKYAFSYCTKLEKIFIPDEIIGIDYGAFLCCENLKEVVIPDSVVRIEDSAFEGCSSLEKIVIPENVETLYTEIFCGCQRLKEIQWGKRTIKTVCVDGYCLEILDKKMFEGTDIQILKCRYFAKDEICYVAKKGKLMVREATKEEVVKQIRAYM